MSTADKIESVILKVLGVSVAVWGVRVLKAAAERKAHEDYYSSKGAEGIGAAERIKRRIYKEVSMAQDEGVDFSKKFPDLTGAERDALIRVGQEVGWKQSKRSIKSGKSYAESYFGSLRRAWNAVSGCNGIGKAYNVRNADGDVVLTWNDVTEHIQQEPDAHTMLALPPHIEPKAKKTKKAKKDDEYWERFSFAKDFLDDYCMRHPQDKEYLLKGLIKQHYEGKWDINDIPDNSYDGLIISFARKELKVKGNNIYFLGDKFSTYSTVTGAASRAAEALLEAWNNRYIDNGFKRDDLDDIRRALLDRAKLMQVVINPYEEYEDKTNYVEKYGTVHDYGTTVSGDERYNYLDKINYIVWTSKRASEQGGMTYYPIRSYPDYDGAEIFVLNKYGKTGAKVLPVWDVPIEKITGVSGIGYIARDWDERYIRDNAGNVYVTFNENYLHYLEKYGADDYDILTARLQLQNCGRVICFLDGEFQGRYGYYEPVDNEYVLDELYNLIDF